MTALAGCSGESTETTPKERTAGSGGNSGSTSKQGTKEDSKKDVKILSDKLEEGDMSSKVVGEVKNTSGKKQSYVGVEVKFKDSEGTRVGEGLDNTTDLPAGETWAFEAAYLGQESIDSYTIKASTSAF